MFTLGVERPAEFSAFAELSAKNDFVGVVVIQPDKT
jgi:hypothetical protein